MDLKKSLVLYGVTLGMRYTKKQKQTFLNDVKKSLQDRQIEYHLQEKQSAILTIDHLIIGDPVSAKKIIAASYDTPSRSLCPGYKWYPFQLSKNHRGDRNNLILETIIVVFLLASAVLMFSFVQAGNVYQKILYSAAGVILALCGYSFSKGKANKVNFSMNSASVALLMDLVQEYGTDGIAYVLMDESVTSLEGVKILKEEIPDTAEILFLNGLAEGSTKMLVHSRKSTMVSTLNNLTDFKDHELSEAQMNQCMLGVYPKGAMLIRGDREGNDFVLCNAKTKRDINIDTAELVKIENALCTWIQN
jgi:hypothetical protein